MRKKHTTFYIIFFFVLLGAILFSVQLYVTIAYPLKYENTITKYANEYSLDKYLVASIINEESSFKKNAVSSKGAKGLMQIQDETGRFIAQSLNEEYNENTLFNPQTNIRYGCWYLNYLRKKFPYKVVYLSAYNAGEGNVNLWLKDKNTSDDGITLSSIPFAQTEEYVSKILHGRKMYNGRF